MKSVHRLVAVVSVLALALHGRLRGDEDRDRGDVPGWVMITMMSALLVAALLAIALPALTGMFQSALAKIGQ